MAPVAAPTAPHRTLWVVSGVLVGVSTASLLVAGMLWMVRNSLPDRTQVVAAYVPTGTVTRVQAPPATPAPEPVLSVNEPPPLPPAPATKPEPQAAPTPGAIAYAASEPSRPAETPAAKAPAVARSSEPLVASTKAEIARPRETAPARRAPVVQERRDIEDPSLEDAQEETPFMQQPAVAAAPAPVAKAAPQPSAPPEKNEFDDAFARELGFTKDTVRKAPESKGVKSVWIPPAPGEQVQESLTPEDIQKVVVTHQPAITSCLRRHKEAIPGLSGGKFVMRWLVSPDGSTYGIAMETQALRGTALATCIEDLVKDWKFPKHQTQMGPIRFPFIF